MAHADQFDFIKLVKDHFPESFENVRVLEIGSLDINGSVRSFFNTTQYTGVDVADGPGVDEVCQGQLVDYPSASFDVVISCECMEHNPYWVETVSNMFRMVKPGGLVIISCATTGRAEHGTTRTSKDDSPLSISIGWEYYHNVSLGEFDRAFNFDYWFDQHLLMANWHNSDLYFVGAVKPAVKAASIQPLKADLETRFGVTQSARSLMVFLAAKLGGEFGTSVLRGLWHLVPKRR